MMKNSKKQSPKKDQYTVVLEDLRSQFKVFGEALMGVDDKVNGVNQRVERMDEKVEKISQVQDSHTETLASHTETLASHTETLASHTETLASHTKTLASHTEMIGKLMVDMTEVKNTLKTKADTKDLKKVAQQVVRLEVKAH